MNDKQEQRKSREKCIFKKFAEICPLDIKSFESKDPPEPDILCELKNGENLAFELVEAVDNKIPQKDIVIEKAEKLWTEYYNSKLSKEERERFDAVFSGCALSLALTDHASEKVIEKAVPLLLKKYQNSCRDQLGLIHHEQDGLPEGCERIRIEPKEAKPIFRCSRASHISSSLVIKAIKSKFEKSYETKHSIHLLIHNDHHSLFMNQSDTKTYIKKKFDSSPFYKIWIFDYLQNKIDFVFPSVE